jgi:hypothetical protein
MPTYGEVRTLAAATAAVLLLLIVSSRAKDSYGRAPTDVDEYLTKLGMSYPDFIAGRGNKFLILKDGTKFQISDNKTNKTSPPHLIGVHARTRAERR